MPTPFTLLAAWKAWPSTLAVLSRSWPGVGPRLRRHAEVERAPCDLRSELLPTPQPDEIVAAFAEEPEVSAEVVRLRGLGTIGTGTVTEVVVDVRSSQVHCPPVARRDREVARVSLRDHERTGCAA